jgi:hypothetical protein
MVNFERLENIDNKVDVDKESKELKKLLETTDKREKLANYFENNLINLFKEKVLGGGREYFSESPLEQYLQQLSTKYESKI